MGNFSAFANGKKKLVNGSCGCVSTLVNFLSIESKREFGEEEFT